MTAEELVEKSKELRKQGRREEALLPALHAAEIDPASADAWWQVALNTYDLRGASAALQALKKTTELAPDFAYGWTRYGLALSDTGDHALALSCFERAVQEDADEDVALRELATIYHEAKDTERELYTLTALERLNLLTPFQLNRLGILHHDKENFHVAIQYYKRVVAENTGAAGLFNLGLVYQELQVSQDADAIDTWRLAAKRYPDHPRAPASLKEAVPRMVAIARQVRERSINLLEAEEWFANYINPFELLDIDTASQLDALDPKIVHRRRKALLREIDLEDGSISWMPGIRIDRSRALSILNELNDSNIATFHAYVLADKNLLNFLSRGDISHFLVDEDASPLQTIELLESETNGFQSWLDGPFSRQFNLVFSRAIERRDPLAVEVLLDGRRWVSLETSHRCFEGAQRQVDRMLDPLRQYASTSERTTPSVQRVRELLEKDSFARILSALPLDFYTFQQEAGLLLRDVSISCHNEHGNSDLAKEILQLCTSFSFKSVSLGHRLDEDMSKLDQLIQEQRKDETKITLGGDACEITKEGVRRAQTFIGVDVLETLRSGIVIWQQAGGLAYEFTFVARGNGRTIEISWRATKDLDEQRRLFGQLLSASLTYLLPSMAERFNARLEAGGRIQIGAVSAERFGVAFPVRGWFSDKTVRVPWNRLVTKIDAGDLVLSDAQSAKSTIRLPLHLTDNAGLLHFVATVLRKT